MRTFEGWHLVVAVEMMPSRKKFCDIQAQWGNKIHQDKPGA